MTGFAEQLQAAKTAHLAASALESVSRQQIVQAYADWESGELNAQTVRHRLEAIIRSAYRASANVAIEHTAQQSGLPDWKPSGTVYRTDYLESLLKDVRRNLREYKASDRTEADRRRHVLRTQHSAGVAAQRGYTDALIESYAELETYGYQLRKVWLANFENNVPCPTCTSLHGTGVGLRDEFKVQASDTAKVYLNLQGPPRHPRCQCYLCILVVDLDNVMDPLDIDKPKPGRSTMTTDEVKSLPVKVFKAVVKSIQLVGKFLKEKTNG